jgi:bifunctional DNA-binding transcriptional regulator/antitoxin component of YhaV-PrlF toxin-antitoxin module
MEKLKRGKRRNVKSKEIIIMALLKGLSEVNKTGMVLIPINMRRELGLREGTLVELKIKGNGLAQEIRIKPLKPAIKKKFNKYRPYQSCKKEL